jgi:Zinc-binding dehydrogenase
MHDGAYVASGAAIGKNALLFSSRAPIAASAGRSLASCSPAVPARSTLARAIRTVIDKVFPFESTNEAMGYVEAGRAKGKVVVKVG